MFFFGLKQICQLLVPFTLVIQAVRYWYFLAQSVDALKAYLTDSDFKAHCVSAFNWRVKDMHNPLAQLAVFLHPWYPGVTAKTDASFQSIQLTAGRVWQSSGNSRQQVTDLLAELAKYRLGSRPFLGTMTDGGLNSLHDFWNSIQYTATSSGAPRQLPALATYIHDIKPHAADPENTFSLMGFFHSARRNQLLNTTTTAMTAIKMHHTQKGDRKVKPERDIQAVLQKEEDFQRLETLAIADAVAEEVKENEAQDECKTSSAVNLELCSTSEMMEVFSEYYGDKHDMAQSHMQINDASINASVDIKAKEFDVDYEGTSAEFQPS
ncbi:TPA: hypothetical protein ACH3X1_000981 [Trebouxia sp. C0004]